MADYAEGVRFVDVDEAKAIWDRGNALFLDVRSPQDYAKSHIPGSWSVPLIQIVRHTRELPRNRPVITY